MTLSPADGADKKHQVISVRKAIEALYYNRYLKKGDEVINASTWLLFSRE